MKTLSIRLTGDDVGEKIKLPLGIMKEATTRAAQAAADLLRVRAAENIKAAGFPKRWYGKALDVKNFPNRKGVFSIDAAAVLEHKIPYSLVFEEGATIRGKPYLWLPLASTPTKSGGRRITPKSFEALTGGKLIPFRDPHTGNLLLGVRVRVPAKQAQGDTTFLKKLSLSKIKRFAHGTAKTGVETTVPVFVAIRTVTLGKKFDIEGVARSVLDELPGLYLRNLEDLKDG